MGLDVPFVREEACFTVPTLYSLNRFETRTRLKGTRSSLKSSLIELNETGPTENASYEHFPEFDLRGKKRERGREKKALYSRTCKLARRNWGKIGLLLFPILFSNIVEFSFIPYSFMLSTVQIILVFFFFFSIFNYENDIFLSMDLEFLTFRYFIKYNNNNKNSFYSWIQSKLIVTRL